MVPTSGRGTFSCPVCDHPGAEPEGCRTCGWKPFSKDRRESNGKGPSYLDRKIEEKTKNDLDAERTIDVQDNGISDGPEGKIQVRSPQNGEPTVIIEGASDWYELEKEEGFQGLVQSEGPKEEPFWSFVGRLSFLGLTLCLLVNLVFGNLIALILSLRYVYSGVDGWRYYLGLPFPRTFLAQRSSSYMMEGLTLQLYWLFIWISILVSTVWFFYRHGPTLRQWFEHWKEEPMANPSQRVADHHPMGVMAGFWALSVSVSLGVYALASLGGAEPEVLDLSDEPAWFSLFLLANASVWEEVMFRVILIGLPLMMISYYRKGGLVSSVRKNLFGGNDEWDEAVVVLVLFSSAYFAYGHVGAGWDWFKFPGTLVAGVMFAFLFVRWGLSASILFHFLFDYALALDYLIQDKAVGAWANGPLYLSLLALLFSMLLGLVSLRWLIPVYWEGFKGGWSSFRASLRTMSR